MGSFLHNAYHFPHALGSAPAGDVLLVTNENNNTNCANAGKLLIASLDGTYDDHGLTITPPNMCRRWRGTRSSASPGRTASSTAP